MSRVLQKMVTSYPWGNLRPWLSKLMWLLWWFWTKAGAATTLRAQLQHRAERGGTGSCGYTGSQWQSLLCFVWMVCACSGPAQSPLLCKGRCRWTKSVVALQSCEPESQPACMWWILGALSDNLCLLEMVAKCSAVFEVSGFFLGINSLWFQEKSLCKGSGESWTQSEQELSEEICFL